LHDALPILADAVARIVALAVGVHDLLVPAEAQQVVAERPLEVQARRLALVDPVVDAAVARMAALALDLAELGLPGVGADDAADRVPRAAVGAGAALVDAVHGLGHEVAGQVAGVGQRPVVAARAGEAFAVRLATGGAVPVVLELAGLRLGLVRERQELEQVAVVDLPVELAAPEVVVAVGVPGLAGVDVARIGVALLVHREEEQVVLHDRARRPDVGLVERGVVAAAAVAL